MLALAALSLGGRAWASTTATVTVTGGEQPGDANAITLSFGSFVETVPYGPYSTPASIASAFGAVFSRDYLPGGLCAIANGPVVSFKLQSGSFGALTVSGPTTSFQISSSGFPSPGGVADSGTIALTVNGVMAAQTNYGEGATTASVAAGLAAGVASNSYVTVTATGSALQLQSKQTGAGTNYSYTLATTSYDSADFSQPSFMNPSASGSLEGGADTGGGTPQTLYSYVIPPPTATTGYAPNGNLLSYTDSVNGGWSFSYDNLNRLTGGSATSGPWSSLNMSWSYDSFGNRTALIPTGSPSAPAPQKESWIYTANNHASTINYDAAGGVTNDGANQYLYDAEGRICAVENTTTDAMTGYLYDAEGNRVAKGTIANMTSCDPAVNGFVVSSEKDSILNPQGEQMTETTVSPSTGAMVSAHVNVWVGAAPLATYAMASQGAPLTFYFNDPLGTRRVETDYAGDTLEQCSSLPYGDDESCQPTPTEHLFTGKERDAESGNDYFGARYYASSAGRFLSPDWSADPVPIPYASLSAPQSLNLYAYASNNPLSFIDEFGHQGAGQSTLSCTSDLSNGPVHNDCEAELEVLQQNSSSSSGGDFWHHLSNLLHGHSWNYVQATVTETEIYTVREPNEAVTAASDAAGLLGLASETVGKTVGPVTALTSIWNDPSKQNITDNVLSLLPGFEEMPITTGVIDFMNYSTENSTPGPKKSYDNQQLLPTLPSQPSECEAFGVDGC